MLLKKILAISAFVVVSIVAEGQPGGGGNPGGGTPVPISGIELLLIGGGAFGVWRMIVGRKSSQK